MPYDLWLGGLAGLAVALFQLGYPEQAVVRCRKAPDAAERLRDPADLAYTLYHACMLDQLRRYAAPSSGEFRGCIRSWPSRAFAQWGAVGAAFDGWALAERGRTQEGIGRLRAGLDAYRATGAALFVPYVLGPPGTAQGGASRATGGRRLLAEALDIASASGERRFEAELHRLEGELALAEGDRAGFEACLQGALTVAHEQNAIIWSSARRPAWPACGATRIDASRHAICSPGSTPVSPRASVVPI
jgi:predicted ATPase